MPRLLLSHRHIYFICLALRHVSIHLDCTIDDFRAKLIGLGHASADDLGNGFFVHRGKCCEGHRTLRELGFQNSTRVEFIPRMQGGAQEPEGRRDGPFQKRNDLKPAWVTRIERTSSKSGKKSTQYSVKAYTFNCRCGKAAEITGVTKHRDIDEATMDVLRKVSNKRRVVETESFRGELTF